MTSCCQCTEKSVEHEWDDSANCSWVNGNDTQRSGKETGRKRDQRKKRDYPENITAKIRLNT